MTPLIHSYRPCLVIGLLFFASLPLSAQQLAVEQSDDAIVLGSRQRTTAVDPTLVSGRNNFPSLRPRTLQSSADQRDNDETTKSSTLTAPAVTVTSSLAVVLGLFAGLVWLTRKYGSRSMGPGSIPQEVLSCLGSTAIDPRTRVTMLRCGERILVLAQTASGVQPISEITDPDEVRRLTAACLGDSKRTFASTIQSIEKEQTEAGFLGDASEPSTPRKRGRLFATA